MNAEFDDAKYNELSKAAIELYYSDAMTIDTYYPPLISASAPCIKNYTWHPLNTWRWKYIVCE